MPVGGELQNRPEFCGFLRFGYDAGRYDIRSLFLHLIVTVVRFIKPGGLGAVVAESVLTRTSNPHPESQPEASSQPERLRSDYRRFMHPLDAPVSRAAMWHRPKTIDAAAFPCIIKRRPAFKVEGARGTASASLCCRGGGELFVLGSGGCVQRTIYLGERGTVE